MSSAFGVTFGARRRYLSMSLGFTVPARSQEIICGAQGVYLFCHCSRDEWFCDTPPLAINAAAAFFTYVGNING
jgi:hypothetical protein